MLRSVVLVILVLPEPVVLHIVVPGVPVVQRTRMLVDVGVPVVVLLIVALLLTVRENGTTTITSWIGWYIQNIGQRWGR